jgi:DNA-binding HxlR family transcriptional regulator
MIERQKRNPGDSEAIGVIEDVVGCKWSLAVLMRIRAGVHRPGELERAVAGVSKKVLNERLRKLQRHGILEKRVFSSPRCSASGRARERSGRRAQRSRRSNGWWIF